jgi:hypothetical protein
MKEEINNNHKVLSFPHRCHSKIIQRPMRNQQDKGEARSTLLFVEKEKYVTISRYCHC